MLFCYLIGVYRLVIVVWFVLVCCFIWRFWLGVCVRLCYWGVGVLLIVLVGVYWLGCDWLGRCCRLVCRFFYWRVVWLVCGWKLYWLLRVGFFWLCVVGGFVVLCVVVYCVSVEDGVVVIVFVVVIVGSFVWIWLLCFFVWFV